MYPFLLEAMPRRPVLGHLTLFHAGHQLPRVTVDDPALHGHTHPKDIEGVGQGRRKPTGRGPREYFGQQTNVRSAVRGDPAGIERPHRGVTTDAQARVEEVPHDKPQKTM